MDGQAYPLAGRVIVIVDDDIVQSELMAEHMRLLGACALGFSDLDGGGTSWRGGPDVVLIDMMLRDHDGMEVTRDLRKRGYGGPVIAFSASMHQLRVAEASGLFAACIAKPWDTAHVLDTVHSAISP